MSGTPSRDDQRLALAVTRFIEDAAHASITTQGGTCRGSEAF